MEDFTAEGKRAVKDKRAFCHVCGECLVIKNERLWCSHCERERGEVRLASVFKVSEKRIPSK